MMAISPHDDFSTLWIKGLALGTDLDEIQNFFERKYGACVIIMVRRKIYGGVLQLGVAFRFKREETAKRILIDFDKNILQGSKVTITYFRDFRRERQEMLREMYESRRHVRRRRRRRSSSRSSSSSSSDHSHRGRQRRRRRDSKRSRSRSSSSSPSRSRSKSRSGSKSGEDGPSKKEEEKASSSSGGKKEHKKKSRGSDKKSGHRDRRRRRERSGSGSGSHTNNKKDNEESNSVDAAAAAGRDGDHEADTAPGTDQHSTEQPIKVDTEESKWAAV